MYYSCIDVHTCISTYPVAHNTYIHTYIHTYTVAHAMWQRLPPPSEDILHKHTYIYIHTYTHATHIHSYIHTYIYTYIHTEWLYHCGKDYHHPPEETVHTYPCTYIHTYTYSGSTNVARTTTTLQKRQCMHIPVHTFIHTYIHTQWLYQCCKDYHHPPEETVHAYPCTYIHTYIHTYTVALPMWQRLPPPSRNPWRETVHPKTQTKHGEPCGRNVRLSYGDDQYGRGAWKA